MVLTVGEKAMEGFQIMTVCAKVHPGLGVGAGVGGGRDGGVFSYLMACWGGGIMGKWNRERSERGGVRQAVWCNHVRK